MNTEHKSLRAVDSCFQSSFGSPKAPTNSQSKCFPNVVLQIVHQRPIVFCLGCSEGEAGGHTPINGLTDDKERRKDEEKYNRYKVLAVRSACTGRRSLSATTGDLDVSNEESDVET